MISRDRERGVRHGEMAPGVAIVQKGLRPFSDHAQTTFPIWEEPISGILHASPWPKVQQNSCRFSSVQFSSG